jgi:outer membrane protein assembly factor BamB
VQTAAPVTNIVVLDDLNSDGKKEIVVSTEDIYFPNVMAYDAEAQKLLWEFSPKMEVYDTNILWTMKQTKVFDMSIVASINGDAYQDVVLSAGYSIYALDGKTGGILWEYKDSDNVWDILIVKDQNNDGQQDVLAGDQNGYVYLISGKTGEKIWEQHVSKTYTVMDPSTNSEAGTVKRSVWDITPVDDKYVAVSAEDGKVYLLEIKTGNIAWEQEVIDYVDTLLFNYYGNNPLPTSSFDYNFFNLRIILVEDATGDGGKDIVATTFPGTRRGKEYKGAKGLYLLNGKNGEVVWRNENIEVNYVDQASIIETDKQYIAIPTGKTGNKDRIKLVDMKDGTLHDTLLINTTSGSRGDNKYYLKPRGKDKFLMVSGNGDLLFIEQPSSVIWSYPRINNIMIKKADITGDSTEDLIIKTKERVDENNLFGEGQTRIIYVIDGATQKLAWSYQMPFEVFTKSGGLYEAKVVPDLNKDKKSDIIAYQQEAGDWNQGDQYGEKTRILVFDGSTGKIILNTSVIDNDYYGRYDELFKNESALDQEIWRWALREWVNQMGPEAEMPGKEIIEAYMNVDARKQEILRRKDDVRIRKRIVSLDIIEDQNQDWIPDLLVGSWEDVFILDSRTGEILWNKTRRPDLYQDPFTGEQPQNIYQNWSTDSASSFLVVGDVNKDNMDDLVMVNWNNIVFLRSKQTAYGLDYDVASKLTFPDGLQKEGVTKIGDINKDGIQDIFFQKYIKDSQPLLIIGSGVNGETLMEIEASGTSAEMNAADFNANGVQDSISFQLWGEQGPTLEIIDGKNQEAIWTFVYSYFEYKKVRK